MLGVVFSRDRAMQLDATLKSFFLHCEDARNIKLCIIYKASDPLHRKQYNQLALEYKWNEQVEFVEQQDFRRDLLNQINPYPTDFLKKRLFNFGTLVGSRLVILDRLWSRIYSQKLILFLVDDNLFVRHFALQEFQIALNIHPETLGFSLRLGENTTYSYPLDKFQSLPEFAGLSDEILCFDWTKADGDFNYPLEISSSIYRIRDLVPLLARLPFSNPNTLENQLAAQSRMFAREKPFLLCMKKSITFCAPLNKVQTTYPNRAGSAPEYSNEKLADMFEQGYRINIEKFSGFLPTSCHQEIKLIFEKSDV